MVQGWLLDTNVLSESVRRTPDEHVMRWLDGLEPEQMHVSVLTLGELRKGVLRAADARRRQRLAAWIDNTLPGWFGPRVLDIDLPVAARWAELPASTGRPLPAIDSLLAATAMKYGLALATRNTRDFDIAGLHVYSPWAEPAP
jgi:toxin FitB